MEKPNFLVRPKDVHLPTPDGWTRYRADLQGWTARAIEALKLITEEDLLKPEHREEVVIYLLYYSRYPLRPGGVQLEVEALNEQVPECPICHSAHPPEEE
jgi:hypothetical protein